MNAPQNALQQAIMQNAVNRAAILDNAMPMRQPLQTQTVVAAVSSSNNVLTFQPRLTGLLTGFLIEVNGTLTNGGAGAATRTGFGAANAISRIQFIDLQNQTRHNSSGRHFALLNSAKLGRAFGGAVAPNLPFNVGNVYTVQSVASSLDASGGSAPSSAIRMMYYVPISYSQTDLRGAIYAQVINATMNLQITLNPTPSVTTTDPLNAIYSGANTSVTWAAGATVKVTQLYYDQLPRANGGPILPLVDLSTMYMIQDSMFGQPVVNSDNQYPYANFRTYLSTFATFDNAGTYNTGSDISYWALQYANLTRQFELTPQMVALWTRNQQGYDTPPGCYYFDHRDYPISTANYGNCELILRPSSVTSNAQVDIGWEMFAQQQAIVSASSLPANS